LNAYITMTSISKWAMLNALWSAIRDHDFKPSRIYMLITPEHEAEGIQASHLFEILLQEYGIQASIHKENISEESVPEAMEKMSGIIRKEKERGAEVALDITSGRKALVAGALLIAWKEKVDHVFYLYLKDLSNANNPYMKIPMHIQHPHDIMKEVNA